VEAGLEEVPDPSGLYLQSRDASVAGVCPSVMLQGKRAVPVEVQALVAPTNSPNPRRGVTGLDSARMAMLQAVTERHGRVRLFDKDSFLAATAGMKISDTGVDLAVCLALASAANGSALPTDVAAVGEVTLSGDIRLAPNMKARLQEAARLGFRRVLCPPNAPRDIAGDITIVETASVADALRALHGWSSQHTTD
jgi:Predicted ATP-dependent serine protease